MPALPGAEVSQASAREAVPAAVGEKASSQGSSSRKSPWAGGGEPQEGPGWALSSGRPPLGAPCLLVPVGLGWRPDLFSFSIPFIAQTTSGPQKTKPLSSADLSSLASIVCRLLILASDHFHPHPPPQRETHTKNSAWKGGGVCGQSSHSHLAATGSGRGLQ